MLHVPTPDLVARLVDIVGPRHAITDAAAQAPFLKEWRDTWTGRTPVVLQPGSTSQVQRILALCHEARVAVVPQSGNTGLVGGQIPSPSGREIVLSTTRLDRIRAVDARGGSMTVEAGVTLADVQKAAEAAGRLFPLTLASQGTCRIGGNLATNAGGVGVLAYGNTRALTLGLEVVLADGALWDGLRGLKKDNAGYDLKDLFIGSEGTLGVITAAALKLFPKPAEIATAIAALPRIEDALTLLDRGLAAAGPQLTAFEFMPRTIVEFVLRNIPGTRDPFPTVHPWYVLIEISGAKADGEAGRCLEQLLSEAAAEGIVGDAVVATSISHAQEFWRLRESASAAQKPEGANVKHDISVPVPLIPQFVHRADALVSRICPGARTLPLGHVGDGNIHYNIAQPVGMDRKAFLAMKGELSAAVHALVVEMGGSIAAEHGIGQMKRQALADLKSPVEIEMMRNIKSALDPRGILNPGKVV